MDDRDGTQTCSAPEGAATESEPSIQPGEILGNRYRIERFLGRGGMGFVHQATDLRVGSLVAVKTLPRNRQSDPHLRFRFAQEGRALSALGRRGAAHVVRVHDRECDDAAEIPYLVMEYLEGRDLGRELKARGCLSEQEAVRLALETCDALADAHAVGIVHRDVKPSNLFLARDRRGVRAVKVLDFGIAKLPPVEGQDFLTGSGSFLGSLPYAPPEQLASSRRADERSDVWSLGVTLYQMLTGQAPFTGSEMEIRAAVSRRTPPSPSKLRPGLMVGLDRVVMGCLERDSDRRIPDAGVLARKLFMFASEDMRPLVESIERRLGGPVEEWPAFEPVRPGHERDDSAPPVSERSPAGRSPTLIPVLASPEEDDGSALDRPKRRTLSGVAIVAIAALVINFGVLAGRSGSLFAPVAAAATQIDETSGLAADRGITLDGASAARFNHVNPSPDVGSVIEDVPAATTAVPATTTAGLAATTAVPATPAPPATTETPDIYFKPGRPPPAPPPPEGPALVPDSPLSTSLPSPKPPPIYIPDPDPRQNP